jgi:ankyrin repeat protein
VSDSPPQAKKLPARPHLGYLKKLAKQRLVSLRAGQLATKLAHAQLVVAREHGFASWRKLKAHVNGLSLQSSHISAEEIDAFSAALRKGNLSSVRNALRRQPTLANIDTGNGETALHLAAEYNHPSVVKLLLKSGADPAAKYGRSGHTPLSWAITSRAFDAAQTLVQAGVKPDLYCAAGLGDRSAVKQFFGDDGTLIAGASHTGSSRYDAAGHLMPCPPTSEVEIISDALYAAARSGKPTVVRELLAHQPDLAFRAYLGGTPLHWAYFSTSRETVSLLLRANADPSVRDDVFKCTPRAFGICVAANWGILTLVRRWLANDPSTANIFDGRGTPLQEAARSGQAAIAKLLLRAGADPSIRDADGKTAMDIAKENQREEVVKLLGKTGHARGAVDQPLLDSFLDAAVPLPDENHKSGSSQPARQMLADYPELARSSIFAACVCGNVKAVRQFLADDPSLANASGGVRNWPALCYLTFSRILRDQKKRAGDFVKCAKLLLDAGADPNSFWPAANDPSYHEAALYGAVGIANCAPLTELLIDAGADVNDHESLYHASEFTDNAALRVLLKAKPQRISYCLCHKMDMEDPAGVKLFIEHGADVNFLLDAGVFKGSRPLHFAIYRRRSLKVFRVLLQAGADPNLPDSRGTTPYQLASKLGQTSVARLLKSKGAITDLDPHTAFLSALSSGDRKTAKAMLKRNPELKVQSTESDHKLLVDAAEAGNLNAVRLMLDIGFPTSARGATYGGWDATALDQAAWHGHGTVVRLLLKRGADPTVKHGFGGDALGAAIHGASHAHHGRGTAAVKWLAEVASAKRLEKAIEYAKTEPNKKVAVSLEKMLNERRAAEGKKQ